MTSRAGRHARTYIKDVVYGANDGIITTFAVVSSIEGARLGTFALLAVGFASLFADGLSMAASDFLASRSEKALAERDRQDEGRSRSDQEEEAERPLVSAGYTFVAFVLVGSVPLIPYVLPPIGGLSRFPLSGAAAALALFTVGALRTRVTKRSPIWAGLEMVLVGGAAALVAFFIGEAVDGLREQS